MAHVGMRVSDQEKELRSVFCFQQTLEGCFLAVCSRARSEKERDFNLFCAMVLL